MTRLRVWIASSVACGLLICAQVASGQTTCLRGEVRDERTRMLIPSRVHIQGQDGRWHFPRSGAPGGSAVSYKKQNWINTNSVEMHTTLSAHPFEVDLPPGRYTITVERGKEYVGQSRSIEVGGRLLEVKFDLHRWVNLAQLGWYSGDTHVHRPFGELPNVMMAEDVNVAFPVAYWVTRAFEPASSGDKNASATSSSSLVKVDDTHVFFSRNTEYEIDFVEGKRHSMGAVLLIGHQNALDRGAPPVGAIAGQVRAQGGLVDLEKHDWPWSIALVPVMKVDLFELANNHVWRTEFAFTNWSSAAPAYMKLPRDGRGGTELDWLHYGFQTYYALLNCGLRIAPSAGTASGVHPVPLGYSRAYVRVGKKFDAGVWIRGLREGCSFITTGPVLLATVEGEQPGHIFQQKSGSRKYTVSGHALHHLPIERIEIVVNGEVAASVHARNKVTETEAYESSFDESIRVVESCWIAVRCFEKGATDKVAFAHTGPFYVEVDNKPVTPRKEEVLYLLGRVESEIERSRGLLPPAALEEYARARAFYQDVLARAR